MLPGRLCPSYLTLALSTILKVGLLGPSLQLSELTNLYYGHVLIFSASHWPPWMNDNELCNCKLRCFQPNLILLLDSQTAVNLTES
jgi:hypothetical protein